MTNKTVQLTVNKAPLTITAQHASRSYGAANPSFTASYSGFVNGENEEDLSGSLTITSSANATSPVGLYLIKASGVSSTNYEIEFVDGELGVNRAPLTITAQDASRNYGAANPSFTVNYSGFVNGENEQDLGGSLTITSSASATSPVGSYPIVASGLTSNNYEIDFADGELTVNQAPLTITAQNASRLVDTANPSFAVNYSGFVNNDDESVLSGTLSITTTATIDSPAGSYPIVASGLSSSNYTINYVNGTLMVDPDIAITWPAPDTITYGTALSNQQLNASANVAGSFSYTPVLDSLLPAGTHTITATFTPDDTSKYTTKQMSILITVNKAPLTISAQNSTRTYGASNPNFTVSYSGFVNAEDESVLTGSLVFTTTAELDSAVGEYPIIPSGLTSENYAISYQNGILTILAESPSSNHQIFLPLAAR